MSVRVSSFCLGEPWLLGRGSRLSEIFYDSTKFEIATILYIRSNPLPLPGSFTAGPFLGNVS